MKVRILKHSKPKVWYADKVGQVLEVSKSRYEDYEFEHELRKSPLAIGMINFGDARLVGDNPHEEVGALETIWIDQR